MALPAWAQREKLYTLSDLSSVKKGLLPIYCSRRMLLEYVTVGKKNPHTGERSRLDVVRFGKPYYTSVERFVAFWDEVNP